jgi:hypothetical protein
MCSCMTLHVRAYQADICKSFTVNEGQNVKKDVLVRNYYE